MKIELGQTRYGWVLPALGSFLCLALGIASGLSTLGGDDRWYQELRKPPGTPPGWVFGPVWSILYLMMGVALGRLIQRRARWAVLLFIMQFALNLSWTPVFFGAKLAGPALGVIVALWLSLLGTILLARRRDGISAWLLAPYLAWVSYATYLNAGIFWLNR
jgi:translocator protein